MPTAAGDAPSFFTLTLAAALHIGLVLAGLLVYVMSTHASAADGWRRWPLAWVLIT